MASRLDQTRDRVKKIIQKFKKAMPNPQCALNHKNAEELLIATILSAQCTDARVNIVTETLFKKYPNMKAFALADISELEQDIRSTGFYKNKAKSIKSCATDIVEKHGGALQYQNLAENGATFGIILPRHT